MKIKQLLLIALIAIGSSLLTVVAYNHYTKSTQTPVFGVNPTNVKFAGYMPTSNPTPGANTDFTYAASITMPTVVHIKTTIGGNNRTMQQRGNTQDPFRDFFGDDFWNRMQPYNRGPEEASGSGVIISADGYIVTNNHVVEDGDKIKVILNNKKEYWANLVGTDPSTDLALLKIDDTNLPYIGFGNSDSTQVGEWVLAVGNPFNLESTVTAGIVSAKGRNINILKDKGSIESFIQTDAAVNPGNSGGALVDLHGNLIGINSAIATPTGSFAGYSFAVPINIVRKVVNDLSKFGMVQRGYLGVSIANITSDLATEKDIKNYDGVYVDSIYPGSAAAEAGVRRGDVITAINGGKVNSVSDLQEQVARYHPGDDVTVTLMRADKEKTLTAKLKNVENGNEYMKKADVESLSALGAQLTDLSDKEKHELGIKNGIKVEKLDNGILTRNTDIREGFVITEIDNNPVSSVKEFQQYLESKKGKGVLIGGTYPNQPGMFYYGFKL